MALASEWSIRWGKIQAAFDRISQRVQDFINPILRLRIARTWAQYSRAHGAVLSGGVAYSALFSLFAALTVGYTGFMTILGDHRRLRDSVLQTVSGWLPGIIDTGDGNGVLKPSQLIAPSIASWTGLIAVVVLLVSSTSFMGSLRAALRAMFQPAELRNENPVVTKIREFGALGGLALSILITSASTIILNQATDWFMEIAGMESNYGHSLWLQAGGFVIGAIVDALTFAMVVLLLAGARPKIKNLCEGAVMAAVALGVLRYGSTAFIGNASSKNILVASLATAVTLLVWVNLLARVVLILAAWTADPPLIEYSDQTDPVGHPHGKGKVNVHAAREYRHVLARTAGSARIRF